MSEGWAIGTEQFRAALIKEHDLTASARAWETGGPEEVRRVHCEEQLTAGLRLVGKQRAKPTEEPKGGLWKVAVAAWMKQTSDASNGWLAERLHMGSATRVSQVVGAVGRQPESPAAQILQGISELLAT